MTGRALGSKLGRFGVVGAISTLLYLGVAELGVRWIGLAPLVANTLAIFVSGAWGYVGHYYVTFRADTAHGTGIIRFLVLFALGNAVSNAIVFLNQSFDLPPESGNIAVALGLPVMNFVVMQLWVFARRAEPVASGREGA